MDGTSGGRQQGDDSAHNWDILVSCNTAGGRRPDRPCVDGGGHKDFLRSVCTNGGHDNSWFNDTK